MRTEPAVRGATIALAIMVAVATVAPPVAAQRATRGEDESTALVEEGRAALRANKLDAAAAALDQALMLNPRRVETYVLRSAVYAARKQYKQGIELMRRAQAIAPDDADVLTALGSHLVLSGDTGAGVPILTKVVTKSPARYDAQLLLGRHYYATGTWPEAIRALESYFQHRPSALGSEDARHRVDLADSYLRLRQPARALELFSRSVAERKTDLRARIGVAWATAALDCRKARPLLKELDPVAEQYPEIWLVDGQCALALGDSNAALERGRRFLERETASDGAPGANAIARSPVRGSAAGHALVAEALAARGNLVEAKRELQIARTLDPRRRRWAVRLAHVERSGGDPTAALATLDDLGPPAMPAIDPDWWTELGEALIASGDSAGAASRLAAVVPEIPGDAGVRTVTGAAQLAAGQPELAVESLGDAEAIATTPRSRKLLVDALVAAAIARLQAGNPQAAEPLLIRADRVDGTPAVWRMLGITRLALDRPVDATSALDRAVKVEPTATTLMLAARAHALTGDRVGARALYERAIASDKGNLEIAIDWAASELAGGDPAAAVSVLERTPATKTHPLAGRHRDALAKARHAAGIAALRAGNGGKAVELLRASAATDNNLAVKCDLALATVVVGDPAPAMTALRAINGQSCPFPPPADTQAAPILLAFTDGRAAGGARAGKAVERLVALGGKATGPALALLNTSLRVVALEAAQHAYSAGRFAEARGYLTAAKNATSRVAADEVAHDLAVLDLVDGKLDAAIAQLDKLAPKVPEALINLGIAYELKADPYRALEAWHRARKAGVRFAPLADWIESKERIYGARP
ncbi:MAG: tetratricopeptide repeat protein [Kofleriaceae bacterium]